ncbi:MAG: hypothetical protein HYW48_00155 [Deltaproteobacteria bacterium]|nr:hypothetical protein [Deltaproteobacteria bacterium]
MRKLFGEYLVEKSIVNRTSLVEVLIEQAAALPSLAEIIYRNNLLSPDDLFNIFSYQVKNGVEFASAAKALGLWSDTLEKDIQNRLNKIRTPIGQLLVKRGLIDAKVLVDAFDDYIENVVKRDASEPVAGEETSGVGQLDFVPKQKG